MLKVLLLCSWVISALLTGRWAFKTSNQLAHPTQLPLASFQGQPVFRSDVEDYYPVFRARAAGELLLAQMAARACGLKKASQTGSEFYLRRLLARDWPETRLREFYAVFKEELTAYEIGCEQWRRSFSPLTLEEEFGRKKAEQIRNLPVGSEFTAGRGVQLRLLSKRSRFEELKPDLLERIFQARRTALVYQLLSEAHLEVMGPLGNDSGVLDFGL